MYIWRCVVLCERTDGRRQTDRQTDRHDEAISLFSQLCVRPSHVEIKFSGTGCELRRWVEVFQDSVGWQVFGLAVLNHEVLQRRNSVHFLLSWGINACFTTISLKTWRHISIHAPCIFIILYYDQQKHDYNSRFGAGVFFKILARPVFKMWILQEPKKIALWNKRHLVEREKKRRKMCRVFKIFSKYICWVNI